MAGVINYDDGVSWISVNRHHSSPPALRIPERFNPLTTCWIAIRAVREAKIAYTMTPFIHLRRTRGARFSAIRHSWSGLAWPGAAIPLCIKTASIFQRLFSFLGRDQADRADPGQHDLVGRAYLTCSTRQPRAMAVISEPLLRIPPILGQSSFSEALAVSWVCGTPPDMLSVRRRSGSFSCRRSVRTGPHLARRALWFGVLVARDRGFPRAPLPLVHSSLNRDGRAVCTGPRWLKESDVTAGAGAKSCSSLRLGLGIR